MHNRENEPSVSPRPYLSEQRSFQFQCTKQGGDTSGFRGNLQLFTNQDLKRKDDLGQFCIVWAVVHKFRYR